MMIKIVLLLCAVAVTRAAGVLSPVAYGVGHFGVYGASYGAPYSVSYDSSYSPYGYGAWNPYNAYPAPAFASQSSNILRSPFNLGQISTYTKAIVAPFSTVRKADVRVSNPAGVPIAPSHEYSTPLISHAPAPLAPVAKVTTDGGLLGRAYSAAPAVSHVTYSSGLGYNYAW